MSGVSRARFANALVILALIVCAFARVAPVRAGVEHWPEFYRLIEQENWRAAAAYAETYNFYLLGDPEDLLNATIALKLIGEYEEAERHARQGVEVSGYAPLLVYELATVQYLRNDWDTAEENFRSLIGSDLPREAREEIYLFLRDIRARSTVRFDIDMTIGRDNNANSAAATRRFRIFIFNFTNPPPEKIWYMDVNPSFYIQRRLSARTGVWFRPSLPMRWASDSDYGSYTLRGAGGINFSNGPWLVRPSLSWANTRPNEGDKSRLITARLAVRRALGRAGVEPFITRRWSRIADDERRTQDREFGLNLTYNFTPNVSGGVQPSVNLRDEVFVATNTRQEQWRFWLYVARGAWNFSPSYTTWRTKHNQSQLEFASPTPLPDRRDKFARLDFTLGNSNWDLRGYAPELRLFSEHHESNDPRYDRKRESGISLGIRRKF